MKGMIQQDLSTKKEEQASRAGFSQSALLVGMCRLLNMTGIPPGVTGYTQ